MGDYQSYLTLSSQAFHSLLAFPPPLVSSDLRHCNYRMTSYARPMPPPIDTLPVELLSYIFVLGSYPDADSLHSGDAKEDLEAAPAFDTESVKAPLAFASVSRYWRRVALDTPSLWTSLCITLEMLRASSSIDTRHITSYLSLSRRYPIDILIDARDPDWDFLEDEITPDSYSYTPAFTVEHMQTVLSLLLPHLSRWRSLSILTDTWRPMQTALQTINPAILQHGAPRLESLTLMRCNDFVSFSPEFEPKSLKDPSFLSPSTTAPPHSPSPLPRLRYLSLRGVHVHWSSLVSSLSSSKTGLYSLELASHSSDVRPSLSELHDLLSCNPRLRSLVVSGSGPAELRANAQETEGVLLPSLSKFTLGYRSGLEGEAVLQLVNAPSLKSLVLEEATYPADPEVIDAGSLLTYLGTGEFHTIKERYLATEQVKVRKDSTASTSTCVETGIEIGGRLIEDDEDDMTLVDFDTKARPPFPHLEKLSLKSVRSSSTQPIASMFGALPKLQSLELVNMTVRPLYTLLPDTFPTPSQYSQSTSAVASTSTLAPPLPMHCPKLSSISLQECNDMQHHDLSFIMNKLVGDRKAHGSCALENIEIQLGYNAPIASQGINLEGGSGAALVSSEPISLERDGVKIRICASLPPYDAEGTYEDEDMEFSDAGGMTPPFSEGGAFNDPYFDAYYTGGAWLSAR